MTRPTVPISWEAIFADDLHLYPRSNREYNLHCLKHVIASAFPGFIQLLKVLWHFEGIQDVKECR